MQLPPSDHIVWKLVEQTIIGLVFAALSYFNYKNGWDIKDLTTLLALWSTAAGFRLVKTKALKEEADNKEEPAS